MMEADMGQVGVICTYYATRRAVLDLPDEKSWNDVEEWHVKGETLHLRLKGDEAWHDVSLNDMDTNDSIDVETPIQVEIGEVDEHGNFTGKELDRLP
jgi:hypothetical protein